MGCIPKSKGVLDSAVIPDLVIWPKVGQADFDSYTGFPPSKFKMLGSTTSIQNIDWFDYSVIRIRFYIICT